MILEFLKPFTVLDFRNPNNFRFSKNKKEWSKTTPK